MSTSGVFSTSEGYHEYIGGVFSTSEGYHEYIGGYYEYIGGCSVHQEDIMIRVGDTMSTSGGYHEYIGGCSVHRSFQ